MVYWFVSSLVSATLQVLLEKLADLSGSFLKVDDKLRKLERTLVRVDALIQDDEQKSSTAWQVLLRDIEGVAYDADDLLDEIAIKVEGAKCKNMDLVSKLLLSLFKHTSAFNMNDIQEKLDGMIKEIESLCLRELVGGRHMMDCELQTSSIVEESSVFGRESDKENITRMLLTSSDDLCRGHDVNIIPIVGMIGVGKTTLAQLLFNNQEVESSFDLRMWVFVTSDSNVVGLMRSILEAANGESISHCLSLELLQVKLMKILRERKFLLVLDDLWNQKDSGVSVISTTGKSTSIVSDTGRDRRWLDTVKVNRWRVVNTEKRRCRGGR
ncbi:hypothetical protein IFM89_022902 [Coptis chinensis]|uniref:Uncharacterized protein n=1 Tax=Coptis chinensis TaxID=261450 RepID=A0A835H696_9MAGN|nr:hypothetical protein IFM89_022902 [Coptis chinensis]